MIATQAGVSQAAAAARPHTREFLADTLTPVALYRRLRSLSPWRFLLESVTGGEQVSRFSFLGAGPSEVLRLYADRLTVERFDESGQSLGAPEAAPGNPLSELRLRVEGVHAERSELPFTGGFVGWFGWDLVRLLERLPSRPPDPFGLPLAVLARFDTVVVFDHARQRVIALANEIEGEVDEAIATARLARLATLLEQPAASAARELPRGPLVPARVGPPSLSDEKYRAAVVRAKEHIAAGDIFQVVLARRWEVEDEQGRPLRLDPETLYRALRVVNPSPYMVLYETPELSLVGASPEMLVRREGDRFELRPIAGTRPRGTSPAEDRELEREMLADPKERAEHVMLVDLGRNDLGRVAAPGGVRVASFLDVERYSHVMHIVSSVEAVRRNDATALDALLACFPAGTLSGAPKIRAMQIIDELEPEARGVYGGAVGYLSFSGDMDTCITIRTLAVEPDRVSITAGAGLVADSDPALEELETRNKAAALLQAVALAAQWEQEA
jgi:anthranilate synthase component I